MAFEELQDNLEILFSNHNLDHFDLQNVTHRESFFYGLNTSQYYATLHDLQRLKPLYINDKMKEFYGFEHNTFSDIDYFYYFLTIHPTSYGVLLDSIVHFKKGGEGYLNLEYRLKNSKNKYEKFLGSTKSIFINKKAELAVTFLTKVEVFSKKNNQKPVNITTREREIIRLYCEGKEIKKIASYLNISESTIKVHLKNIYKKLGIRICRELSSYFEKFS